MKTTLVPFLDHASKRTVYVNPAHVVTVREVSRIESIVTLSGGEALKIMDRTVDEVAEALVGEGKVPE